MWRATNPDGTLTYSFIKTSTPPHPLLPGRLAGRCVLFGMLPDGMEHVCT